MIQSHLYTNKKETGLYPIRGESDNPVCLLNLGTWLGELDRVDEWIHVVGIRGDGWVKAEDVSSIAPFNLHAQWTGKTVEYVSSAA